MAELDLYLETSWTRSLSKQDGQSDLLEQESPGHRHCSLGNSAPSNAFLASLEDLGEAWYHSDSLKMVSIPSWFWKHQLAGSFTLDVEGESTRCFDSLS